MHEEYYRYRDIFRRIRLPLAFVDLKPFDANIAYVAGTQQNTGKKIRVHSKSIRSVPLIRRVLERGGDAFQGIMTFSVEETVFLAESGLDDFIIAYPTLQPADLDLFATITRQGVHAALMIDSIEQMKLLSNAGQKQQTRLRACLDLDVSFRPFNSGLHLGTRRSPIRSPQDALRVAAASVNDKWVKIDAVMGYEGHVAGPNDDLPGKKIKNFLIRFLKRASVKELTRRRIKVIQALKDRGIDIGVVNGGGSGSLKSTGCDPSITEVTAGSAFFAPGLFQHFKDVSFKSSAFFAIQAVRKPAPNMLTCQGGGYVASGPAGFDKLPVPVYPQGLKLLPLEGAGEVQTPLLLPDNCPDIDLGDPVFFQHAKGGELSERFNDFYLVEGNRIVDTAKTYRGEGKAFI